MGRMAILQVHVVPNAMSDCVVGEHGGAVKIKLHAPAVEGKANAALISFLAEQLNISRGAIALEQGHKSRDKLIRVRWIESGRRAQPIARKRSRVLKAARTHSSHFICDRFCVLAGSALFVTAWLAGAARV